MKKAKNVFYLFANGVTTEYLLHAMLCLVWWKTDILVMLLVMLPLNPRLFQPQSHLLKCHYSTEKYTKHRRQAQDPQAGKRTENQACIIIPNISMCMTVYMSDKQNNTNTTQLTSSSRPPLLTAPNASMPLYPKPILARHIQSSKQH